MQKNATMFITLITDVVITTAAMVALRASLAALLIKCKVQSGRLLVTDR
ncbi:hypothetical protein [Candidatus Avelusimicrobium luingense]